MEERTKNLLKKLNKRVENVYSIKEDLGNSSISILPKKNNSNYLAIIIGIVIILAVYFVFIA